LDFEHHALRSPDPDPASIVLLIDPLNNWRHHEVTLESTIDPFSSASGFDGWKESPRAFPAEYLPLPVAEPATWLLRVGWKRHGPISVYAVPGGKHAE